MRKVLLLGAPAGHKGRRAWPLVRTLLPFFLIAVLACKQARLLVRRVCHKVWGMLLTCCSPHTAAPDLSTAGAPRRAVWHLGTVAGQQSVPARGAGRFSAGRGAGAGRRRICAQATRQGLCGQGKSLVPVVSTWQRPPTACHTPFCRRWRPARGPVQARLVVAAGDGGSGCVSLWKSAGKGKFQPADGGSGGRGGDVLVQACPRCGAPPRARRAWLCAGATWTALGGAAALPPPALLSPVLRGAPKAQAAFSAACRPRVCPGGPAPQRGGLTPSPRAPPARGACRRCSTCSVRRPASAGASSARSACVAPTACCACRSAPSCSGGRRRPRAPRPPGSSRSCRRSRRRAPRVPRRTRPAPWTTKAVMAVPNTTPTTRAGAARARAPPARRRSASRTWCRPGSASRSRAAARAAAATPPSAPAATGAPRGGPRACMKGLG